MEHKAKIIFFGTPEFSIYSLRALVETGLVPVAVVTTPDKPAGRGRKLTASAVKTWIMKHEARNIKLLQPEKIDKDFLLHVSGFMPTLGIVASYGKILPKALIDIFPKGMLNVHPSLLPKHRGAAPIQAPILQGEKTTGVTIMLMDEKMDHGPVVTQTKFGSIDLGSACYQELHDALARLGAELLVETLPKWLAGAIKPREQDHTQATFTKLLKKEDGLLDLSWPPEKIDRHVRALNPWPGTYIKFMEHEAQNMKQEKILKIKKTKIQDGKLKILVVQPEGGREMTTEEYQRGHLGSEI